MAEYFLNRNASGTVVATSCESAIDFNWGLGFPGGARADNWSVNYSGQFNFAAGTYTFRLRSDDGARLYVDGVQLINAWYDHGAEDEWTANKTLTAGLHTIRVQYYDKTDEAEVHVSW